MPCICTECGERLEDCDSIVCARCLCGITCEKTKQEEQAGPPATDE